MKFVKFILSFAFILILGYLVYSIYDSGQSMKIDDVMEKDNADVMVKDDAMAKDSDEIVDKDPSMDEEDSVLTDPEVSAATHARLLEFSEAEYESAKASGKLVVLYFYANWCPLCEEEFPLMQSAFRELPDNVIGFKVNYKDTETTEAEKSLAREFGVAYQHTKIFIKDRKQILKAPDTWSKEKYLEEINKLA